MLVYQMPSRLRPKFIHAYLESDLVSEFLYLTRRLTVLHLVADYHLAYSDEPGNGTRNRNAAATGLHGIDGPAYVFALEPGCGRLHDVVPCEVLDILRVLRDSCGGINVAEVLANAELVELDDGPTESSDDDRDEEEHQEEE